MLMRNDRLIKTDDETIFEERRVANYRRRF